LLNPKYAGCFSCNENAFRNFPNHRCVGVPFRKVHNVPGELQALIIFDGGIISVESTKDSLRRMVKHFVQEQNSGVLYFKFHPGQNEVIRTEYRSFLMSLAKEEKIDIRELSAEWIVEDLAYTLGPNLSVYIICSSVGLYSHVCGCRVYTTAEHYMDKYELLKRHFQAYGCIFDKYEKI